MKLPGNFTINQIIYNKKFPFYIKISTVVPFKCLRSVTFMFLKELSYANQGCIYFIKTSLKTVKL